MTHRIRVAHLVQHLATGGLERMASALALMGEAQGVDGVLVGYLGATDYRASLTERGVKTALLQTAPGLAPSLPLRLAQWLMEERIDVLHTHHLGPFVYGAAAARIARIPHVHTEHSHEFYDVPRRRVFGRAMPHLSRTIAVTRQVADFHKQSLGNSIEVIENGVAIGALPDAQARTAARSRLGVPDGAFVVGCVARLAQEKRHDRLLEAFKRMRTPAHLVLIGDGPSRASLETLAAALGLASRVHFLGTQLNPEALLPGLDVITLTSDREGLPMSLLEGMAAAIPVVATAVGGIPALLANDAGIAIAPDDSDLFAASLDALAADPARRETLGARGRARAIAHHSLEAMSAAYVSVYREELKRCA
jgi:glycosyltransferase involved in cell wall biosynthesis